MNSTRHTQSFGRRWTLALLLFASVVAALNISCARKENDTEGMPKELPVFDAKGKNGFCVRAYMDLRNRLTSDYNVFMAGWDEEKQSGNVTMDLERVEDLQGDLTKYLDRYSTVECKAKCTQASDGSMLCSHDEAAAGETVNMTNEKFPPMLETVSTYVTQRKAAEGQGVEPAAATVIEKSWTIDQVSRVIQANGNE